MTRYAFSFDVRFREGGRLKLEPRWPSLFAFYLEDWKLERRQKHGFFLDLDLLFGLRAPPAGFADSCHIGDPTSKNM